MREDWQEIERIYLAPYAAHSYESRGRVRPEAECPIRTVWQRDRDRIIHSKAFRRLKHKTQVFINPEGDHVRTRLTHTLEVSQISRTLARALRLNEDLTEAIALGHDLGHTPFGHIGERALKAIDPEFNHCRQSLRQIDVLEKDGQGLNLTMEVRDGIRYHSGKELPFTLEGMLIRLSDRIAYLNHDIDDAIRSGFLTTADLPEQVCAVLGNTHAKRINTMVTDIIDQSSGIPEIKMSPPVAAAMDELRAFMFEKVYFRRDMLEEEARLKQLIFGLYDFFLHHPDKLPAEYDRSCVSRAVCDYIAGMTDSYALALAAEVLK
ncbi:MAG: deoxyguanosinetriphosphate triphosphohydrolase [Firmicutes bacterium]|nr:deoxyguanosinetriphosphate triphosphohydrolase [Bacillota bacterium]